MMLVIYWKSGPSKGYSDLYPSDWFDAEGEWAFRSHDVRGPQNGLHPARCTLSVRDNIADLDYGGEHAAHNERWHYVGTLRIIFASSARDQVQAVQWRDADAGAKFVKEDVYAFELDIPLTGLGTFDPFDTEDGRKKIERMVVVRQGQPTFRQSLINAYERRCAITGCTIEDILEAAHISPYRGEATHHVTNGLLLRADIHTLFDRGLIKISPDYRVSASEHVAAAYNLPASITLPRNPELHPSPDALAQKWG